MGRVGLGRVEEYQLVPGAGLTHKQTFPTRTCKTARMYIDFEAHKMCSLLTNLQLPTRNGFEVMNF